MIFPAAPPVPAPPRPASVTVAFALQLALAGMLLLTIVLAIADTIHYDGLIDQALRATGGTATEDAGFERSANVSTMFVPIGLALPLAVWLGVNAFFVRRGSNVARILSLIGLGLPLLLGIASCVVGGLLGLMFFSLLASSGPDGSFGEDDEFFAEDMYGPDVSAFYDELYRLDSGGWSLAYDVLSTTAVVTALLLGIAVAVLLLTGAANRFFRPRPPMPFPPVPWPPYHHYR
ncbi:MAG: hypothetical protein ABW022_23300 [Actinoplanes sp.]